MRFVLNQLQWAELLHKSQVAEDERRNDPSWAVTADALATTIRSARPVRIGFSVEINDPAQAAEVACELQNAADICDSNSELVPEAAADYRSLTRKAHLIAKAFALPEPDGITARHVS